MVKSYEKSNRVSKENRGSSMNNQPIFPNHNFSTINYTEPVCKYCKKDKFKNEFAKFLNHEVTNICKKCFDEIGKSLFDIKRKKYPEEYCNFFRLYYSIIKNDYLEYEIEVVSECYLQMTSSMAGNYRYECNFEQCIFQKTLKGKR